MYTTKNFIGPMMALVFGIDIPSNFQNLNKVNYQEIIKKVKVTIHDWSHRGLSILGNVMVLNRLVGSLFAYSMALVQEIAQDVVQELNSIMNTFLWNCKRPKIKTDILMIAWLHRAQSDEFTHAMSYYFLNNISGNILWQANLHSADVDKIFQRHFWRDVLRAWCRFNYPTLQNKTQVLNSYIWYNSEITRLPTQAHPNNTHCWPLRVLDIVYGNQFITYQEYKNYFDESFMYLEYCALISAFSLKWK